MPELAALHIADPPERWAALGFDMRARQIELGGVRLELGAPGSGITAWSLTGIDAPLDGLPSAPPLRSPEPHSKSHPNGAIALDHVVLVTPDFERTQHALAAAGLPLKRVTQMRGTRMGFRRAGPAILELVEARGSETTAFWGLVIVVRDLDALAQRLAPHLGEIRPAVQPGRRIATVRSSAGLSTNLAFMDPDPAGGRPGRDAETGHELT